MSKVTEKKNLRFRKWVYHELIDTDDADYDDYDGEVTVTERARKSQPKKRIKPRDVKVDSECTDLTCKPVYSPELDTVRIYFDCDGFVDLDKYIPAVSQKAMRVATRLPDGTFRIGTEFYRSEMRCSWYGHMQIRKEVKRMGYKGWDQHVVLCFEYSVAKWNHYASAVNSGDEPCADLLLRPCCEAMAISHIDDYSDKTLVYIFKEFYKRAEIRRFDLSLNFKVPPIYTPTEYVNLIARCNLNRQEARREGDGSISYGTDKSPYRTIWYDKEAEAKAYYNRKEGMAPIAYYEDKDGRVYNDPGEGREYRIFDIDKEKKNFYDRNKDKFKNNIRFEIQFRTKFMQEHNLMTQGKENIDNVIRLGVMYWKDVLDRFDEQLTSKNFEYKDDVKEPVARALESIDERKLNGTYTSSIANNMTCFIMDCYKEGWKNVRDRIGSSLFCQKRKRILTELDYDVKVALPEQLPIMRIMSGIMMSREGRMIKDFVFRPAPVEQLAV